MAIWGPPRPPPPGLARHHCLPGAACGSGGLAVFHTAHHAAPQPGPPAAADRRLPQVPPFPHRYARICPCSSVASGLPGVSGAMMRMHASCVLETCSSQESLQARFEAIRRCTIKADLNIVRTCRLVLAQRALWPDAVLVHQQPAQHGPAAVLETAGAPPARLVDQFQHRQQQPRAC